MKFYGVVEIETPGDARDEIFADIVERELVNAAADLRESLAEIDGAAVRLAAPEPVLLRTELLLYALRENGVNLP